MKPHQWIPLAWCCHFLLLVSSSPIPINHSSDASALLDFKSTADLRNRLNFPLITTPNFCKWKGIRCSNDSRPRAIQVVITNNNLGGVFAPNTLTRLRELRFLSLFNNSLTGPIPDLSPLLHLKAIFLSRNYFSGAVPPSLSMLHSLKIIDLSANTLSGSIPAFSNLNRLLCLRLDSNRFNGSIPPFNFFSLQIFNVSRNALIGPIPHTPTLYRFNSSSFAMNPDLCGEIINKQCPSPPQEMRLENHKSSMATAMAIGFSLGVTFFVISLICFCLKTRKGQITKIPVDDIISAEKEAAMRIEEESEELEGKVKRAQRRTAEKSGSLVFFGEEPESEPPVFSIAQLMKACAALLGKGTIGNTYKAVLESRSIVTVKRFDGERLAEISREAFERHMGSVGKLRHPNLVPVMAYAQVNQERLLIYEYQSNGSLFSLIHSGKPLHWTSCLKIAEDTAQGLCYLHQISNSVHGNIKSTNILLGSDFEARLTDYCLVPLGGLPSDAQSVAYRAPELLEFGHCQGTLKSDVYSFGVLLLELVTGKNPSHDVVTVAREGRKWLEMLVEVGMVCRATSPEQRPTMWQVLKMIQPIKEVALMEDRP